MAAHLANRRGSYQYDPRSSKAETLSPRGSDMLHENIYCECYCMRKLSLEQYGWLSVVHKL